jgi:hypothetical protein
MYLQCLSGAICENGTCMRTTPIICDRPSNSLPVPVAVSTPAAMGVFALNESLTSSIIRESVWTNLEASATHFLRAPVTLIAPPKNSPYVYMTHNAALAGPVFRIAYARV